MTGFITRRAQAALAAHAAATVITLRACTSGNTLLAGMMQAAAEACLHEAAECLAALAVVITRRTANALAEAGDATFNDASCPSAITLTAAGIARAQLLRDAQGVAA